MQTFSCFLLFFVFQVQNLPRCRHYSCIWVHACHIFVCVTRARLVCPPWLAFILLQQKPFALQIFCQVLGFFPLIAPMFSIDSAASRWFFGVVEDWEFCVVFTTLWAIKLPCLLIFWQLPHQWNVKKGLQIFLQRLEVWKILKVSWCLRNLSNRLIHRWIHLCKKYDLVQYRPPFLLMWLSPESLKMNFSFILPKSTLTLVFQCRGDFDTRTEELKPDG